MTIEPYGAQFDGSPHACGESAVDGVTANGKIPKRARIRFPTFVKWLYLRHNGLVGQRAEVEATNAESGGPIHAQRCVP